MTTFANLGACMGPVAMVLTGFVIGSYNVPELLRNKKVYVATLLRLIVIPALVLALLYALGAGRDTLILAIFGFGTPLGMNTVIVPAAYGGETKTGAAMTMISHVACILTIPLLYMLLTQLV
jgi:predicted permease